MKQLLILGGGTAGTLLAHKTTRTLAPAEWRVTVVDRDDRHLYQPGLLFIPFGMDRAEEDFRSRKAQMPPEARYIESAILSLDEVNRTVLLENGERLTYDLLVIATGTRVDPAATEGLTGAAWGKTAFDFYTLEGALGLKRAMETFTGGRLVLNIADMPIKCPVAPLEFVLLADAWARNRQIREKTEIVLVTPLSGAFTKPVAAGRLGGLLESRGISVVPDFSIGSVDGEAQTIKAWDGRTERFDLLVSIPLHFGAPFLMGHKLADASGFVKTDKHTLQVEGHPEIFAIGDATNLPTSKAGSVAHFEGEVLLTNLLRAAEGLAPLPEFDGHANCFVETGDGKAMLLDFNYTTEPLPGRFPLPGVGPFTLLEESAVNHWGKRAFRWVYWNLLIRGEELPLDHRMALAGKWSA